MVFAGMRGVDREDERPGAEHADRHEVLVRVVVDLLDARHHRDLRRGAEQQRVAVGRRLRDIGRGQRAGRADAVLHDEALFQFIGKPAACHPRHDVGIAAGRERDHDRHGLGRPIGALRVNRCRQDEEEQGQCDACTRSKQLHESSFFQLGCGRHRHSRLAGPLHNGRKRHGRGRLPHAHAMGKRRRSLRRPVPAELRRHHVLIAHGAVDAAPCDAGIRSCR